eukprot:c15096_g2_i1 orf=3-398(-)
MSARMNAAFAHSISEGSSSPPCILANRTEDVSPHLMSITVRHQRSKSAPDEKAAFANSDISLQSLNQDLGCLRNQKDAGKATKPKMQGVKKKDRLISLKQDVEHLQVMLKGQKATKGVLEQALARASSVLIP